MDEKPDIAEEPNELFEHFRFVVDKGHIGIFGRRNNGKSSLINALAGRSSEIEPRAWEFWCKEGDPFPVRTQKLLEQHKIGLFGAITSKPK